MTESKNRFVKFQRQSGPTFRFKEDYNRKRFFPFPRDLVKNGAWGSWPTSAQTVFPVLLYFMNGKGTCIPSMDTIGILCRRDRKTVSDGIEFLHESQIPLRRSMRITETGRKAYTYSYPVVTWQRGLFFPFRHAVMDGGNWRHLTPSAQALYVTMRTYGGVTSSDVRETFEDYPELQLNDEYPMRDFDFCRADRDVLGLQSGIKDYRTLDAALKSLADCYLIERDNDMDIDENETWKVFLTPLTYYKRDYLNAQIDKKFPLSKKLSKKLNKKLTKKEQRNATAF